MHTKSIVFFFWHHIKPYKWFYFAMMLAPIISSFYPFAYNYSIKLLLDIMETQDQLTYQRLFLPISIFLIAQFTLELVWKISNIAKWKSEPYVRGSLISESYDYVQYHSYSFFQNNFTGAISSKLKSILDGYDKFWTEMHHGLLTEIIKSIVNLGALCFISIHLGIFVLIWIIIYVSIMYKLSIRLNRLSFEETESRHLLIGQIADKITNIISLFSFSSRERELKSLNEQVASDFIPKQIKVYRYDFKVQIVGGTLYIVMFGFILLYMIHLRILGSVSIGDFAFVFGIALVVAQDIWRVTVSLQNFSRAMGDLKSALSILNIPQQNLDNRNAQSFIIKKPTIEFKNVCFGYNDKTLIFQKLNLIIQAGEKVGLV